MKSNFSVAVWEYNYYKTRNTTKFAVFIYTEWNSYTWQMPDNGIVVGIALRLIL